MIAFIENWISDMLQTQGDVFMLLVQSGVFAGVLLLAPLLARVLLRYANRFADQLGRVTLLQRLPAHAEGFATVGRIVQPLLAWLMARIGVVVLDQFGRESSLLLWLSGFLLIWLVYRLIHAALTLWLPLASAHRLTRRIMRPVAFVVALIHLTGLLDEFLNLGFTVQAVRITLGAMVAGLAVFVIAVLLSRGARSYLQSTFLPGAGLDESLSAVLATLSGYVLLVAGFLLALTVAGFNLTGLTVILGGLSVGLAFGLQEIISNFFSGFVLLFERSVAHGDVIGMEDELGVVQDVGIRATVLRTIKDVELIVPNTQFLTNVVTNYSRGENRAIRLEIAVFTYYDRNPVLVREAMLAAAARVDGLAAEPAPYVEFQAFGADRTNEFTLEVWIQNVWDFDEISSDLRFYIWEEMDARQLHFPPLQHELTLRDSTAVAPNRPS